MTDREPDLDALLRSDARAWRDQVDAASPDLVPTPTHRRTAAPYVAGLVAAALVVGLAVLVMNLRPDDKGRIEAGGPGSSGATSAGSAIPNPVPTGSEDPGAPVSAPAIRAGQVPPVAYCPTEGTGGVASGFGVSFAEGFAGAPTVEAAAAKFPPKHVQWTVAAQNGRAALLTYASHYLHLIRLSG